MSSYLTKLHYSVQESGRNILSTNRLLSSVSGVQQHRKGHGVYGPEDPTRFSSNSRNNNNNYRSSSRRLNNKPFFEHSPFDPQTGKGGRNLTTVEGGRVVLTCTVRNLGTNRTVGKNSRRGLENDLGGGLGNRCPRSFRATFASPY